MPLPGFLDRLLAVKTPPAVSALTEQKAAVLRYSSSLFDLPGNPGAISLVVTRHDDSATEVGRNGAAGTSTLVLSCMLFRARKLAEAPLWLADEANGAESWLDGDMAHPLARLLERPNDDQPLARFLATLSWAMDLGPTLVLKIRDRTGAVGALRIVTWDAFTVKPAWVRGRLLEYGMFTVADRSGQPVDVASDEAIYFPTLGVAPVDAALGHVRISERMRRTVKASLAQAMRPAGVVTLGDGTSQENFDRTEAGLRMKYAGPDNAGKTVILAGQDVKYTQVTSSLKDVELGPVQGDVEAAICQAFQLHPALVGAKIALENSSGLSDSLKPALSLAYDLVFMPRWQEIETAFTEGLLREIAGEPPTRFVRFVKDKVRALQPDMTADVNVAKAATGIMTLDEQRAVIHLPPLGASMGGDVIAPAAGTGQAPVSGATAAQDATKSATPGTIETKAGRLATEEERAAYWRAFDAKAAPKVGAYEVAARARFREERAGVLALLRAAVPKAAQVEFERKNARRDPPRRTWMCPICQTHNEMDGWQSKCWKCFCAIPKDAAPIVETKDDAGGTVDRTDAENAIRAAWEAPYVEAALLQIAADYAIDGPYAQAWADEFGELLRVTMRTAAGEFITASARVGVTFSMDNPALLAAIRDRAAALVRFVTDTTRQAIVDAIESGRAEGLTIAQLAERVDQRAFGASARARARAIANTEVVGAINSAEWTAATESGVFRSKRWIHTRRPGDRDYHDAHEYEGPDGGWVPLDYQYRAQNGFAFPRPFAPGLAASEVVHCGCVLAYSDVDPAQAAEEQG